MSKMNNEDALLDLQYAINNLDGIVIPYNIIKNCIQPLKKWVDGEINEHG